MSTKMLLGLILQSRKLPSPSPLSREMKLPDGLKIWAPGLTDWITLAKTSLSYGPNSSTSLKLNSKTSTNNNEQGWHSTSATCSGPTSPNMYPTLKNTLDKLDTHKEMLRPLIYSSKDFPPEYWQIYSNLHMLGDRKIPNKKQSMPLNPLSYSTPSCLLNEAITLLRTVEIKEIHLCTL